MVELTDAEIDAALARGKALASREPRARSASYHPCLGRVVVELTNGCGFSFPPHMVQGLENAAPEHLAEVEILGNGYGLHWEALDTDVSVPGLLAGVFGTKAYMARLAGQAKSSAKARAARVNGARGGRPRKAVGG
jgi:hypothetical protein